MIPFSCGSTANLQVRSQLVDQANEGLFLPNAQRFLISPGAVFQLDADKLGVAEIGGMPKEEMGRCCFPDGRVCSSC